MYNKKVLVYENGFDNDTEDFKLEGKGKYEFREGKLYLDDSEHREGLTLWLKKPFEGDLHIMYEAMVIEPELNGNVNLFFMAKSLNDGYVLDEEHNGEYDQYHRTCKMYIATFVGKPKTSEGTGHYSRFRKDPGFLLINENSSISTHLNEKYLIEAIKKGNEIEYKVNGKTIHKITDNEPYNDGCIGFRTWSTRMWIDNFKVYSIV